MTYVVILKKPWGGNKMTRKASELILLSRNIKTGRQQSGNVFDLGVRRFASY